MLSIETLRKAQLELTRLNRELHALHLDEERCKLRRSAWKVRRHASIAGRYL
jgi:hypothetical protein